MSRVAAPPTAMLDALTRDLFDENDTATRGGRIAFWAFEVFVVLAAAQLAWSWALYTLRIDHVVLALGVANYLSPELLYGTELPLALAGACTLALALGLTRRTRYAYAAAFVLLHLQYAARFVLGEIPHSANLVGMALLGLAIAHIAFAEPAQRRRFAFGFNIFFVGLGYTSAAVCKLLATGLTWPAGRHLRLWVHEKHIDSLAKFGDAPLNLVQEWALASEPFGTLILTIGLVTELFAVGLWMRRLRAPIALGILGLHMGIYFSMGILFFEAMVIVTLIGFPWGRWIDSLLAR